MAGEEVHRLTKKALAGDVEALRALLNILTGSGVPVAVYAAYALVYQFAMNNLIDVSEECRRCGGRCCREGHPVPLYSFDIEELVRNLGPGVLAKLIRSGDTWLLPRPCPFQEGWRCTIHRFKPYACLSYPFATEDEQIEEMKRYRGSGIPKLRVPPGCPAGEKVKESVDAVAEGLRRRLGRDPTPQELLEELLRVYRR